MIKKTFRDLLPGNKPILGMIHLTGRNRQEKVARALEELRIYEGEGIDGAIVEDYHGKFDDLNAALEQTAQRSGNIVIGVNDLQHTFNKNYNVFDLASHYGIQFVQVDSVEAKDLDMDAYQKMRKSHPNIPVLGGIGFKYKSPSESPLEVELRQGIERAEAIVTTGSGTAQVTPMEKLRNYRSTLDSIAPNFPLIVGAGVNVENAYEQLETTDGAIIGSAFKYDGNSRNSVDRKNVAAIVKQRDRFR